MGIFSSPKKPKKPPPPPSTPTRADARASLAGGGQLAGLSINPSLITNIGGPLGLAKARGKKKSLIGAT